MDDPASEDRLIAIMHGTADAHAAARPTGDAEDAREERFLRYLVGLELRLTNTINTAITAIRADHTKSLIAQAELNAKFATTDALTLVANAVEHHSADIAQLQNEQAKGTTTTIRRLGYVAVACTATFSTLIAAAIAHLWK